MEPMPDAAWVVKNLRWGRGPRGKQIVLLKDCSYKIITNDTLLYPSINVSEKLLPESTWELSQWPLTGQCAENERPWNTEF